MTFDSGEEITWIYDAAGVKLYKVSTNADPTPVSVRKDYLGGIEYADNVVEAIYHSEGRAVPNGSDYTFEYTLKDHLGNSRVTFADLDKDGEVAQSEILQTNHYYPFGMAMELPSQLMGNPNNAYQYNGKELNSDFGLDWLDYGARWYDASIGRWSAVDPLSEKYYSISPYVYVANNPLKYIDPDGQNYILIIDHKTQTITVTAFYLKKDGETSYIQETNKMIDEGISFWNSMSGKFSYEDKYGNLYKVNFNLKARKEGHDNEQDEEIQKDLKEAKKKGYIIPRNSLAIIPDGTSAKLQGKTEKNGDILGSNFQDKILIEESAKHDEDVVRHEFGHNLGMEHSSKFSILSSQHHNINDKVLAENIESLLGRAGIGSAKRLKSSTKKTEALGVGTVAHFYGEKKHMPHNFENGKKVVKNE